MNLQFGKDAFLAFLVIFLLSCINPGSAAANGTPSQCSLVERLKDHF